MFLTQIEITNRCNLSCRYCPRTKNPPHETRDITPSGFNHILKEMSSIPWITQERIAICGHGEPLMHPNLIEVLEVLSQYKFPAVDFSTNATLLNYDLMRAIVDLNVLKFIGISLQSTKKEVMELLQRGAKFERVVSNVKDLIAYARGKPIRIRIQYLRTRLNPNERASDFEDLLGTKFDDQVYYHIHNVGPVGMRAPTYSYDSLVVKRKNEVLYGHMPACGSHFGGNLIINAWGDLVGCCWDNTRSQIYGNIYESSLRDLRNSELLKELRIEMKNRNFRRLPLCRGCLEVQ